MYAAIVSYGKCVSMASVNVKYTCQEMEQWILHQSGSVNEFHLAKIFQEYKRILLLMPYR